jgi:hypothetical protein
VALISHIAALWLRFCCPFGIVLCTLLDAGVIKTWCQFSFCYVLFGTVLSTLLDVGVMKHSFENFEGFSS